MPPELTKPGIFHDVVRNCTEGSPFDNVESQHDNGVRNRRDAIGNP